MLVYNSTLNGFLNSVESNIIDDEIEKAFVNTVANRVNPNEKRSWRNSMQYMHTLLNSSNIPRNTGVAIEFVVPPTSKRIDFMLSGYDDEGNHSIVIIELKQWDEAEKVDSMKDIVRTYVGGAKREVTHPSYQAWTYAVLLEDYNQFIQENNIDIYPCAYLHNYTIDVDDPLTDDIYAEVINNAKLFGKTDNHSLKEFISRHIKEGDDQEVLYEINNSPLRPSKSLQNSLSEMLENNEYFTLIDNQKVAFEYAQDLARNSYADDKKRVLIVEGGPGTGKSVVAINLLVELTKDELSSFYVSKNSAPRDVYSEKLKNGSRRNIRNLFKGSGSFLNAKKNQYDVLIVDEAHRLNEKSGFYSNQGENQIKEIINASKTSVFFIDEKQKVHIKDVGNKADIELFAEELGAELHYIKLESQFRCNGSDGYINWLDNVLEIEENANFSFDKDFNFDFKIFDSPTELDNAIYEKNKLNNNSRVVAGYCWNWKNDTRDDSTVHDIEIGDFSKSWNLDNTKTWAIDKGSFNEIGCIHTCQGLEFDYVGVIIGNDIRYENGEIVTDFNERASSDRSLFGIKKMYKEDPENALKEADIIIKNTYRTLMSRGLKGCYIYCVDKNLQEYFKKRLNNGNVNE